MTFTVLAIGLGFAVLGDKSFNDGHPFTGILHALLSGVCLIIAIWIKSRNDTVLQKSHTDQG
jgi:hypothetical protein